MGGPIPEKYGYTRQNINPPLNIENIPEDTESLVLIMDDPDAVEPAGKVWDHWVVWNINPNKTQIPEDWNPETAIEGKNDYGDIGYGGPNPPDKTHIYKFKLYAIDTTLDLSSGATKREIEEKIENHILAKKELKGTYSP